MKRYVPQLVTLLLAIIAAYAAGFNTGKKATLPIALEESAMTREAGPLVEASHEPRAENAPAEAIRTETNRPVARPPIDFQATGREDAANDIEAALAHARSLQGREQIHYIYGVFAYIATHSSPTDALTIANGQDGAIRSIALKSLVAEWTNDPQASETDQANRQQRILGFRSGRFGLEVELAGILANARAQPETAYAWIDSFSDHPGRSEILARLAPGAPDFDFAATIAQSQNWTQWEKTASPNRSWTIGRAKIPKARGTGIQTIEIP